MPALIENLRIALGPFASRLACAYLFGSVARGEGRPDSDLDIAILFLEEPPRSLDGLGLDIAGELERSTGYPVDLIVLNRAPPDLVHRVLRDGILLLETDRTARVRFEVRSRSDYFDVLPHLREYRRGSGDHHDRR